MSDASAPLSTPTLASGSGVLERIASPFVVGVAARVGGQIIAFSLVIIAARYLTLDAFGTYALAAAAGVIATTLVFTGLYHAILRSTDLAAHLDTLFWLMAGVGALGTTVILAVGLAFGGMETQLGLALLVAALLPLLAVPNAWNEAQLVRAARVRAASLYVLVSEAIGLGVAIWCLERGWGLYSLIAARYITVISALFITTALVRRLPRLRYNPETMRAAAGTALPIWGTSGIGMFSAYGADMVLAAYLNPAAVGAFRSGARIATTASDVIFQPLRMLSWSRFARLEQDGDARGISAAWCTNTALSCAMLWPVMAGVALVAEDLVVTVFDPSWAAAAPVLAILCLSHVLSSPQALTEPALMCMKRPRLQVGLRVFGGLLLLCALVSLGRYGAAHAAAAAALTALVTTIVVLAVLIRVLSLRPGQLLRTFLPGAGLAAAVAASVPLLTPAVAGLGTALALLCHVGLGATIWAAGLAAFIRAGLVEIPKP